jgi:cell division protein FtsL
MQISIFFRDWFIKHRWKLLLLVFIAVSVIVFWINNVNYVNNLILENHRLESKIRDYRSENEELRQNLFQLCSPERIIFYSQNELHLIVNDEAPILLIDSIREQTYEKSKK